MSPGHRLKFREVRDFYFLEMIWEQSPQRPRMREAAASAVHCLFYRAAEAGFVLTLGDLAFSQCVESVLMEDDTASIDGHAKKLMDRRAIETKPGGNVRSIRDNEIGAEITIRDVSVVFF
jgi:hypothetical protein